MKRSPSQMNADDYAALTAYTAQFRGDTWREVALMAHEGKTYHVTPEGVEFSRNKRDGFTPLGKSNTVRVIDVNTDGRILTEIVGRETWGVWLRAEYLIEVTE